MPPRTPVADWPAYLLKGIPANTREALIARAIDDDLSVNDIIRAALCAHYDLDCLPESNMHVARYLGSDTILIRMQPALYKLIKRETRNRYGAVRALILETLTDYLEAPVD